MPKSFFDVNRFVIGEDVFFGKSDFDIDAELRSPIASGNASGRYLDSDRNPIRPPTPPFSEPFKDRNSNASRLSLTYALYKEKIECARAIDRESKKLFDHLTASDDSRADAKLLKMMANEPIPMSPLSRSVEGKVNFKRTHRQSSSSCLFTNIVARNDIPSVPAEQSLPIASSVPGVYSVQHEGGTKIKIKLRSSAKRSRNNKENELDSGAPVVKKQAIEKVVEQEKREIEALQQPIADPDTMDSLSFASSPTHGKMATKAGKRRVAHRSTDYILSTRRVLQATNPPPPETASSKSKTNSLRHSIMKKIAKYKGYSKRPAKRIKASIENVDTNIQPSPKVELPKYPIPGSLSDGSRSRTESENSSESSRQSDSKASHKTKPTAGKRINDGTCLKSAADQADATSRSAVKKRKIEAVEPPRVETAKQQMLQRLHGNSLFLMGPGAKPIDECFVHRNLS